MPKHYLEELRLAVAKKLLKTTDLKIKQAMIGVGFTDKCHFDREFRRTYQDIPLKYRNSQNLKSGLFIENYCL